MKCKVRFRWDGLTSEHAMSMSVFLSGWGIPTNCRRYGTEGRKPRSDLPEPKMARELFPSHPALINNNEEGTLLWSFPAGFQHPNPAKSSQGKVP